MKIAFVQIQNFRKLKNCKIDFGDENTLFVGPNNSGKTSAMEALVKFLARKEFKFNDITLSNHNLINEIGNEWVKESSIQSKKIVNNWEQILPALDIWLDIEDNEMQYISDIIPNLNWEGKRVGVRLLFQPVDELKMYSEYLEIYNNSRSLELKNKKKEKSIQLWPIDLCDYISKKIGSLFTIKSYILDCKKIDYENSIPQELDCEMECIQKEPLKKIIKIDIIEAQRGFYDPDSNKMKVHQRGCLCN
jgi:predicted ATP-binding protein involved in virulence